jgi:hypothetical protein
VDAQLLHGGNTWVTSDQDVDWTVNIVCDTQEHYHNVFDAFYRVYEDLFGLHELKLTLPKKGGSKSTADGSETDGLTKDYVKKFVARPGQKDWLDKQLLVILLANPNSFPNVDELNWFLSWYHDAKYCALTVARVWFLQFLKKVNVFINDPFERADRLSDNTNFFDSSIHAVNDESSEESFRAWE